jgi:hypothetical protein
MKRMILFFVLLVNCFNIILAVESKIAIVGDSPQADKVAALVLTKLSAKDNIVILERGEIDKLLKEQKLSRSGMTAAQLAGFARIAHVDISAVINSAKYGEKNVVSSLLVFDAKSGFKLRDIRLEGKLEDNVKTTSQAVEAILAQLRDSQKLNYVAVLSVRNAGVPSKYKYKLENIAEEVQRRLVASPKVAVLERSRLGLVNKERKLNGKQYHLLSSAYLLDFEFSQGSSANIVNLKLYIMSTDGKVLKKYEYLNCLKTPDKTVSLLLKNINVLLKNISITTEIPSNKQEAIRYFTEYSFYKQLKKYETAKNKLESAIALAPNNIKYLVEYQTAIVNAAAHGRRVSREERLKEYVKAGYAIISNGDLIHDLAPDNREWIFNQHALFEKIYRLCEWQDRKRELDLISYKQLRLADRMLDKLRPKALEESKRLWLKFDLRDGINSPIELKNYAAYLEVSIRPYYYCDFNKMLRRYFENIVLLVNAYKTYNQKHPPEKINPLPLTSPHASSDFLDALVLQFKSEAAQKAINAYKNYPGNSLKCYGLLLEFYRKCALGGFEKNDFSKNVDWLFAQYDKNIVQSPMLILTVANLKPELFKIYRQKRRQFIAGRTSRDSWESIHGKLSSTEDIESIAQIIIKHKNILQKWRRANNKDNRIDIREMPASVIRKMGIRLTHTLTSRDFRGNKQLLWQALEALNSPLKVSLVKNIHRIRNSIIENARLYKQKVYFLSKHNLDAEIHVFDLNSGKVKKIGKYKKVFSDRYYIKRLSHALLPFYVNDNFFIIGGVEKITLISRHDSKVSYIDSLPALYVHALTIFNKRIYAFVGDFQKVNILFSCKVDGSSRKVHISTLRRDKQNIFDKQKYFYESGLFADDKHQRIMFAAGSKVAGLWEFYPGTGKFNKVISYYDTYSVNTTRLNSMIYLAANGNYSNYYIFNMNDNSLDFAYFNDHPQRTKRFKNKPRYAEWLNLNPPFYVNANDLWAGGYGVAFVDLKTGNGMYSIYGIERGMGREASILFFPCPDGRSVYAFNRNSIYRITPPPESGVKENK